MSSNGAPPIGKSYLLTLALLCGCSCNDSRSEEPESCVRIEYPNAPGAKPIHNVEISWGMMIDSWRAMPPGTLLVDCGAPYGAPLRFEFDYNGRHIWWDNRVGDPDVKAKYMVLLVVGPDGTITEEHCKEPCELPSRM